MVGTNPTSDNDLSRRWTIITAKGDLLPGNEYAARYFINGEIGCEEISAEEAGYKAAALGGSLEAAVNR